MLCFSSLQSLLSFCQNSDSLFTIELISGTELLVELVATYSTQEKQLNLACLVRWATHTVGLAQKGQPRASLVMSSSVTRAFNNLCPSSQWHYRELAAVALRLSHFSFCRKETMIWCLTCKHMPRNSTVWLVWIKIFDSFTLFCQQQSSPLVPVGSMRGLPMKVWLEQSCSSRGRRRRCRGSRPTWPAGSPEQASTPQMTH